MPLAPFYVPLVFDYLHYKHCCCFITAPSCWGWGCIHLFGQTEISFSFSFFFFFSFCTYLACKTGICKQDWAELSPKYPLACNGFKDWQRKVPRTHQKFQIRASAVPHSNLAGTSQRGFNLQMWAANEKIPPEEPSGQSSQEEPPIKSLLRGADLQQLSL